MSNNLDQKNICCNSSNIAKSKQRNFSSNSSEQQYLQKESSIIGFPVEDKKAMNKNFESDEIEKEKKDSVDYYKDSNPMNMNKNTLSKNYVDSKRLLAQCKKYLNFYFLKIYFSLK